VFLCLANASNVRPGLAAQQYRPNLAPTQALVALTGDMPADQQPSLAGRQIFVFGRSCQTDKVTWHCRIPQNLRWGVHLGRTAEELGDDGSAVAPPWVGTPR
jgi:hypothetical protein